MLQKCSDPPLNKPLSVEDDAAVLLEVQVVAEVNTLSDSEFWLNMSGSLRFRTCAVYEVVDRMMSMAMLDAKLGWPCTFSLAPRHRKPNL